MFINKIAKIFNRFSGFLALLALLILIVFFGFDTDNIFSSEFVFLCRVFAFIGALSILLRYFSSLKWNIWIVTYDVLFLSYFSFITYGYFEQDLIFYSRISFVQNRLSKNWT